MSLFGSNLKAQISAYEALFATIGFDYAKSAEQPGSLKAFVDGLVNAARAEGARTAGADLLATLKLTAIEGKSAAETITAALAAKDATINLYMTGLADAGVKPSASDATAGLTPADVKAAIEARASQKSATIVAAAGHEAALTTPASDAGEPADEAGYVAAIEAKTNSTKKWSLFRAAQKKFGWR